jgi:hypothetical protein
LPVYSLGFNDNPGSPFLRAENLSNGAWLAVSFPGIVWAVRSTQGVRLEKNFFAVMGGEKINFVMYNFYLKIFPQVLEPRWINGPKLLNQSASVRLTVFFG